MQRSGIDTIKYHTYSHDVSLNSDIKSKTKSSWPAGFCLLVWFDSLRPSEHFFSYVGTGLQGLNQYKARINVFCSKIHLCPAVFFRMDLAWRITHGPPLYYHVGVETGPRSAVGNVSGHRCVSDCRSRGREFDPGPVPYFCGDWSWNNFYGHSPPFRWFIQEGLLSVTSESMCTNYWLTACSSLPRKKCG